MLGSSWPAVAGLTSKNKKESKKTNELLRNSSLGLVWSPHADTIPSSENMHRLLNLICSEGLSAGFRMDGGTCSGVCRFMRIGGP